ncbi:hypothetical protein AB1Y20_005628 [Prymnesium parvum]|uniref:Neurotransmitter-gated ion-channel ligand-binding domain-containing protein n=1 Tax=Prymnesium parvum TaxID=97485 RepID=A0AB34J6B0_PRYPA
MGSGIVSVGDAYDEGLPPSMEKRLSSSCLGPTVVRAQFYINKIHSISEVVQTIKAEAFFRLYWNDHRLVNNNTGCAVNRTYNSVAGLWVPDYYIENAFDSEFAEDPEDGEMVTVSSNGDVFWSQRTRLLLDCPMDFWRMPFDIHHCTIELGMYRSSADDVVIVWHETGATQFRPNMRSTHWAFITNPENDISFISKYSDYSAARAIITIERKNTALVTFAIVVGMLFVIASYTGFFISPGAAPARIALGFLCFLMVLNNLNAVRGKLPDGLSISKSWLLLFLFYCMLFNFAALVEYGVVNFASSTHAKLEAVKKASATSDGDKAGVRQPIQVQPLELSHVKLSADRRFDESVAKLKDLDLTCRWLFPLSFVTGAVCFLVPAFFAGPF